MPGSESTGAPVLDPTGFERLRRIGGEKLVEAMVAAFLENAPKRVDAAVDSFERGDRVGIARAAHSLKSTAGNLGAAAVQLMAERLEREAETAGDSELGELVAELEKRFAELVETLGKTGK